VFPALARPAGKARLQSWQEPEKLHEHHGPAGWRRPTARSSPPHLRRRIPPVAQDRAGAKIPARFDDKGLYRQDAHRDFKRDRRDHGKGRSPPGTETFASSTPPTLSERASAGDGETTIGGRRELFNSSGMFMIEEIERLMLERCTTARQAIKLAGELVKQYGYGDFGSASPSPTERGLAIRDLRTGLRQKGAIWAAVRIRRPYRRIREHPRIRSSTSRTGQLLGFRKRHLFRRRKGWYDSRAASRSVLEGLRGRKPFDVRNTSSSIPWRRRSG